MPPNIPSAVPEGQIKSRRSRARSHLLLARVSNLPTVWSNVVAGFIGAAVTAPSGPGLDATAGVLVPLASLSLFYTGGMFLNDAFDAGVDAAARPERPIPSGDISRREAFAVGAAMLVLGELLMWPDVTSLALGGVLAAAIVAYDFNHKGNPVAPFVMGACRGLVYLAAASHTGTVPAAVAAGAGLMTAYVASLTVVARKAGAEARWLVPLLISGISLLDAAFLLVVVPGQPMVAGLAALGCPLTLALQRWVPGD